MENTVQLESPVEETAETIQEQLDLLTKEAEVLGTLIQEKEYLIDIDSFTVFKNIMKRIEHSVEWSNSDVAGIVMLYQALKEQKEKPALQKECKLTLKTTNTVVLYKLLLSMKGKGYFEAREHLQILTAVGKSLSAAVQAIEEDNKSLRELHVKLTELDTKLLAKKECE